jgi:hypothetical protein
MRNFANNPNYVFVFEDKNNGVGIRTSHELKKQMSIAFSIVLSESRFKFHSTLQTITDKMTPQLMKEELVKQMKDFSIKLQRPANNKFAPPIELYTGKSGYGYDDLMMTVLINHIMYLRFMTNSHVYGKYY